MLSSDVRKALREIASRSLGPHEQEHLVDAAFDLPYSDDVADVLVTLLANPIVTEQTRSAIASRVEDIPFTSTRERIVRALTESLPPASSDARP